MSNIRMTASMMIAAALSVGCASSPQPTAQARGMGNCGTCVVSLAPGASGSVDSQAATALVALRREEKIAHDVYVALGAKFDPMPFKHIPNSEIQHAAAMHTLLLNHGIADPVEGLPPNRFDDPAAQKLYDDLVRKGSTDVRSALAAGVEVEELDISELRAMLASGVPDDIKSVVTQLERASQNHLRAFYRNLAMRGGTYDPKHLPKADFDAILAASQGRVN